MSVKAISFIAKSGTGKTTLVEKVITILKQRSYRVGALKHDAYKFDIDHPGKDSHRFTMAGADIMLITSSAKLALVKQHEDSPPIEELLETYFSDMDIVLVEGFKKSSLPKIEVHRSACGKELLCQEEMAESTLLAIASDTDLKTDVPLLDLNNPIVVADFIEHNLLGLPAMPF